MRKKKEKKKRENGRLVFVNKERGGEQAAARCKDEYKYVRENSKYKNIGWAPYNGVMVNESFLKVITTIYSEFEPYRMPYTQDTAVE